DGFVVPAWSAGGAHVILEIQIGYEVIGEGRAVQRGVELVYGYQGPVRRGAHPELADDLRASRRGVRGRDPPAGRALTAEPVPTPEEAVPNPRRRESRRRTALPPRRSGDPYIPSGRTGVTSLRGRTGSTSARGRRRRAGPGRWRARCGPPPPATGGPG